MAQRYDDTGNKRRKSTMKRCWSTRVNDFSFVVPHTKPVVIPLWQTLMFSGLAPSLASVITNPFEVAKVRLQLQSSSPSTVPKFNGTLDCLKQTWKLEGIKGLQRGLSLVLWQNSARNIVRLGLYERVMQILHPNSKTISKLNTRKSKKIRDPPPLWKRIVGGGICGALGAISGNPLDIIKTRWQAQGKGQTVVHNYHSVGHAFRTVLKQEGIKGLYVGILNNMVLNAIGGAAQLATMYSLRDHLLNTGWTDSFYLDLGCSVASAAATVIAINPVDVIRTQNYNAGKGANGKYPTMMETAIKILRADGPKVLFKGVAAHFMFVVPKYALTFVILGRVQVLAKHYQEKTEEKRRMRTAFDAMDSNDDGVISASELRKALKTTAPVVYGANMTREERNMEIEEQVTRMLHISASGNRIGFTEFLHFGHELQIVLSLKELLKAFNKLDKEQTGKVHISALKQAIVGSYKESIKEIETDTWWGEEEIMNKRQRNIEQAKVVIDSCTTDKNKMVDFEGFLQVCHRLEDLELSRVLWLWTKAPVG